MTPWGTGERVYIPSEYHQMEREDLKTPEHRHKAEGSKFNKKTS